MATAAGFEPAPPKRVDFKSTAVDHCAKPSYLDKTFNGIRHAMEIPRNQQLKSICIPVPKTNNKH